MRSREGRSHRVPLSNPGPGGWGGGKQTQFGDRKGADLAGGSDIPGLWCTCTGLAGGLPLPLPSQTVRPTDPPRLTREELGNLPENLGPYQRESMSACPFRRPHTQKQERRRPATTSRQSSGFLTPPFHWQDFTLPPSTKHERSRPIS